jgi:hypothetical protein
VTGADFLALLHRQQFRCAYSGEPLTPENVSADHRQPVSRGGSHDIENLALVTLAVNASKGSLSLDEFVSMCRKVTAVFGVGTATIASVPTVDELSGETDPVVILTRLGYVAAADAVRSDKVRLKSYDRTRRPGKPVNFEELTDKKKAKIAELNKEIQRLQVARQYQKRQVLLQTGESA